MDEAELFGQGIAFPPRLNAEGRWQFSTGAENIRDSIKIILLTAPDERILLPHFGCGLHPYLFEPNTVATRRLIEEAIRQALGRWEPRIQLQDVTVDEVENEPAEALARITYRLVATNTAERLSLTLNFQET